MSSDLHLARQALVEFGLVGGRLERVATGLDSTYRCVTSGGERFAVRVACTLPIRRPDAVAAEAEWIDALGRDEPDVVVPRVRRTVDGRGAVAVLHDDDGRERACIVLTWLPGRKARWRFAVHHARATGCALAGLHRHAATLHNGRASASALKEWDAARMCGGSGASDALVDVAGERARDIVAFVKERATEADAAIPPHSRGLVNGDIGPHNIVWQDAVPGFFDFNDTGIGSFAFDLARYLRTMRWRAKGDALVAAALEGYESVRPLPDGWHEYGHVYEAASNVFLAGYLAPTVAVRGAETAATVIRLIDEAAKTVGM